MIGDNLTEFYSKIEKDIRLIAAYVQLKQVKQIIPFCRLKPYQSVYQKHSHMTKLHKQWVDEYGNLVIFKQKKMDVVRNDVALNKAIISDFYQGLSVDKISLISKLALIEVAKDDVSLQDYFVVSLLGIDNYLRTFVYLMGEWQYYPSCYLNFEVLRDIVTFSKMNNNFVQLNHTNVIYPTVFSKSWITSWPPNQDFVKILSSHSEKLINQLKEGL